MAVSVLVVLVTMVITVTSNCLNRQDTPLRRNLYIDGHAQPLLIEGSNRITHQLANHILKIILKEVLGYEKVEIVVQDETTDADVVVRRISGCQDAECTGLPLYPIPITMVNIEVWMLPGFNVESWVSSGRLIDCGPLGPFARFGWYVDSATVMKLWRQKAIILDHWRAYQLPTVAKHFDCLPEISDLLKDSDSGEYYCQDQDCSNGIYYSPLCSMNRSPPCATLFTDYPGTASDILKKQIEHFGMYVNIAWIGPNLGKFIMEKAASNHSAIFFSWQPNTFTSGSNYTRLKFPQCNDDRQTRKPEDCDFEINQLSKVVWAALRDRAQEAFHVINHLTFTQKTYQNLLNTYREHSIKHTVLDQSALFHAIACDWLKNNDDIWQEWIPKDLSNKTMVYLGGMFPMSRRYWKQPSLVTSVNMALESVNADPNVLRDYQLEVLVWDTQCAPDEVMKAFIEYVTNTTHPIAGVLGPGCSEPAEPLAQVSKHFNTIVLSYGAESPVLSRRDKYPYFFRTVPHIGQHGDVFVKAFKELGWKQVGIIVETEHYSFLQSQFEESGINLALYLKVPKDTHSFDATPYLRQLQEKKVTIIIGEFYDYAARAVMCGALKMGMTARQGYQWFLPSWYEEGWWDTDSYNKPPLGRINQPSIQESVDCSTAEMLKAINGHMLISQAFFDADNEVATGAGNITVGQWREKFTKRISKQSSEGDQRYSYRFSNYAGYAYDAVWVYAYALDGLLCKYPGALGSLRSERTVMQLMGFMNKTDFKGITGHLSFHGADRTGIIQIQQFYNENITTVGRYKPTKEGGGKLIMNISQIHWLTHNRQKPDDGSRGSAHPEQCQIEAFRAFFGVDCNIAIVLANVLGFGVLVILLIIIPIVIKRRYDKKARATRARMKELGLMSQDVDWLNLDEWELPRDKVVINRKLGEGAFGTVYGGEAYMKSDMNGSETNKNVHCSWVACAVKTLKVGSSPQEKLDFLTEAELMKRFDHKNIVKLLGVCTRGEPVYCIMEFMLYGDLKTYMLARRQLVNTSPDHEEISPTSLTRMALDVIRGLQYLTDNKYVHRDLACRNCLVGESRVVKIGDFGMTRPMLEQDYYRFSRKGMLPVRWMAPESLSDGIFTQFSDIWSFGVLLYEILTFGSFPYQGLSNNQVLEFVKMGNKLCIPQACSKEMVDLFEACWRYEPFDRPRPEDLIEYVLERPTLIKPCLDTPASAVVIEGTDSLEFAMPPRKYTSTSRSFSGSASAGLLQHLISAVPEGTKLINKNEDSATVTRSSSGGSLFPVTTDNVDYVTIASQEHCDSHSVSDHIRRSVEKMYGSKDNIVTRSLDKLFSSKDRVVGAKENAPKPPEISKQCDNDKKNHIGNNISMTLRYISLPSDDKINGDCCRDQLTHV